MTTFSLIESAADLAALCTRLGALDPAMPIGIDTEFERIKTFHPRLGLLQLSFEGEQFLIDPLNLELGELLWLLGTTASPVLFFSGSEDYEVLRHESAVAGLDTALPVNLVDLQVLLGFTGGEPQRGLAWALNEHLGVELLKESTRSDWLKRPLDAVQLDYAADDTAYLEALWNKLRDRCDERHYVWFTAEMARLRDLTLQDPDPERLYLEIGGAVNLDGEGLTRLRYLASVRYQYARNNNIAPNRLLPVASLVPLIRKLPRNGNELADCGLKWGTIREHGDFILEQIKKIRHLSADADIIGPARPLSAGIQRRLKQRLEARAAELQLAPGLLSSRSLIADLQEARRDGRVAILASSWRRELTADILAEFTN